MREIGPYLHTLTLTNWGEPFLHPDLMKMITFAKSFGIFTGLSTNFQILRPDQECEIVRSGLDAIAISVDGPDQQIYQQYRAGGKLKKVIENTRRVLSMRKTENSATPMIRWQCLVTRFNEHSLSDMQQLAEESGVDEILFVPIYVGIKSMFTEPPYQRYKKDQHWLPRNEKFRQVDSSTGRLRATPQHCSLLWESAVINWDGGVSPCCSLVDEADDYGCVNQQTFFSIWNGSKYRQSRKLFTSKASHPGLPCAACKKFGVPIR